MALPQDLCGELLLEVEPDAAQAQSVEYRYVYMITWMSPA